MVAEPEPEAFADPESWAEPETWANPDAWADPEALAYAEPGLLFGKKQSQPEETTVKVMRCRCRRRKCPVTPSPC